MTPTNARVPLPYDPELEPVAAAKAALEQEARRANDGAASGLQEVTRARPVIAPAKLQDWEKIVVLHYPLTVDGELLEKLVLRRITARDVADLVMDGLEGISLNAAARALVAGVHPDVLESLAAEDAEAVLGAIGPFLPPAVIALAGAMEEALAEV